MHRFRICTSTPGEKRRVSKFGWMWQLFSWILLDRSVVYLFDFWHPPCAGVNKGYFASLPRLKHRINIYKRRPEHYYGRGRTSRERLAASHILRKKSAAIRLFLPIGGLFPLRGALVNRVLFPAVCLKNYPFWTPASRRRSLCRIASMNTSVLVEPVRDCSTCVVVLSEHELGFLSGVRWSYTESISLLFRFSLRVILAFFVNKSRILGVKGFENKP